MTHLGDAEIWALESLGRFFLMQERYQRAATVFNALSQLHPDRPYAWYGLALLHERGGDPARALELYAHSVSVSGSDPEYSLRHAEACLRQDDPATARVILADLARTGPEEIAQRATALRRVHQF